MKNKTTKQERVSDKMNSLVLFLSDVCWFLKGWRPLVITWEEPYKTKFRWRLARKRRKIQAAVLERKKQNARNEFPKD